MGDSYLSWSNGRLFESVLQKLEAKVWNKPTLDIFALKWHLDELLRRQGDPQIDVWRSKLELVKLKIDAEFEIALRNLDWSGMVKNGSLGDV